MIIEKTICMYSLLKRKEPLYDYSNIKKLQIILTNEHTNY